MVLLGPVTKPPHYTKLGCVLLKRMERRISGGREKGNRMPALNLTLNGPAGRVSSLFSVLNEKESWKKFLNERRAYESEDNSSLSYKEKIDWKNNLDRKRLKNNFENKSNAVTFAIVMLVVLTICYMPFKLLSRLYKLFFFKLKANQNAFKILLQTQNLFSLEFFNVDH